MFYMHFYVYSNLLIQVYIPNLVKKGISDGNSIPNLSVVSENHLSRKTRNWKDIHLFLVRTWYSQGRMIINKHIAHQPIDAFIMSPWKLFPDP